MFYFVSIFFFLIFHKRTLPLFHSFILALTIFPAIYYLLSLLGIKIPHNVYLDILALVAFLIFILYRTVKILKHIFRSDKSIIINLSLIGFFFAYFAFVYYNSFILPGHDPIAVPSLAKLIYNAGCIPKTLSPLGEEPFWYPPGYSIFISIFYSFNNPFIVLFLFKYLNIIVVSVTPAIWAFYLRKVYNLYSLKSYYILFSFYCGYLLFDRTLILALAFAGKNAALYSYFLFPAIFYGFLKDNKTNLDKIIIILSLLGMVLIHYSFLFMFSILMFCHIAINISILRKDIVKYLLLFSSSVLLFLPMIYVTLKSGSVPSYDAGEPSFAKAWTYLKMIVFSQKSSFFWIFHHVKKWPYKQVYLLVFILVPSLYFMAQKFIFKRRILKEEESIFRGALVFFLSIIGSMILASGLFAKPVFHLDYVRWFSYNYYALLGAFFLIFVCAMVNRMKNKFGIRMFCVGYFIILPLIYFMFINDFRSAYLMVNAQKISYGEMQNLKTVLDGLSRDCDCNLITESRTLSGKGWCLTMQGYKPLDYYAVISECKIVNGSWITLPRNESRKVLKLPSQKFYESQYNGCLYFVGRQDTLYKYLKQIEKISAHKSESLTKEVGVYKIIKGG